MLLTDVDAMPCRGMAGGLNVYNSASNCWHALVVMQ